MCQYPWDGIESNGCDRVEWAIGQAIGSHLKREHTLPAGGPRVRRSPLVVGLAKSAMQQLTAMLERTLDGAMLVNEDGDVIFWNKAAEQLLGFSAQEVIGHPCRDILRGETLSGHPLCSSSCAVRCKLSSGRGLRNYDMQTHAKSGRVVWINVSSLPVPLRERGRFMALHLFRDITKRITMLTLAEDLHALLATPGGHLVSGISRKGSPPPAADSLPAMSRALPLSKREKDVLCLLAAGHTTKAIADTLCISSVTARNHIQHILEKLGVHTRLQAIAIAFAPGVPSPRH
ncbi:MAG: PAS domain-containing protein [Gaiellales bacterium]|nr:MAG: PAS domain-containing protein [Gaiellales bacterium]